MNVLSRHISLGRAAFEPLLAQAAADTLGMVADPSGSFQRLLLGTAETVTLAGLRDNLRYIDIDKAFFRDLSRACPPASEPQPRFSRCTASSCTTPPTTRPTSPCSAWSPSSAPCCPSPPPTCWKMARFQLPVPPQAAPGCPGGRAGSSRSKARGACSGKRSGASANLRFCSGRKRSGASASHAARATVCRSRLAAAFDRAPSSLCTKS